MENSRPERPLVSSDTENMGNSQLFESPLESGSSSASAAVSGPMSSSHTGLAGADGSPLAAAQVESTAKGSDSTVEVMKTPPEANVETGEKSSLSTKEKEKEKGGRRKPAELASDPEILKRISWSEVANPGLSLDGRIEKAKSDLAPLESNKKEWLAAGKPGCLFCHRTHPPPCMSEADRDQFSVTVHLLKVYKKQKRDATVKDGADAQEKKSAREGVTKAPPLCERCGSKHWGKCKKPKCSSCKRSHWSQQSCEHSRRLFVAAGLLKDEGTASNQGPLGPGEEEEDDDDEMEKFAVLYNSVSTAAVGKLGKLLSTLQKKRKDPPPGGDQVPGKKSKS